MSSRIFADEIVNLAGTGSVLFPQGAKIPTGKTLDLSNASINLSAGKGIAGQALTSTGTGLNWTSLQDLNTTYSLSTEDGATNKKTIKLTGSDGITDSIVLAGGSNITLTRVNDEIIIASTATGGGTTTEVSGVKFIQDTVPTGAVEGDIWFDYSMSGLFVYTKVDQTANPASYVWVQV